MRSLNDLKIGTRLNLIISITFILVIGGLGWYTINNQQEKIISDTDTRMFEQVNDLVKFLDAQVEKNQESVNNALKTSEFFLHNSGDLRIQSDENVRLQVINQNTNSRHQQTVNAWYLDSTKIHNNTALVDKLKEITGADVSIFQKIPNGYCRISTTVMNEDGERALGTFVPNSSPAVQNIENGQVYKGRAKVVDEMYLTAQKPIRINGEIRGIIGVGTNEKNLEAIREIFYNKTYYENGYPYMIRSNGYVTVHPDDATEETNVSDFGFIQEMFSSNTEQGKMRYKWEGKWKYQYYKYYEPIDSYVATTIYEEDLMDIIATTRNGILVAVALGIILFLIINTWITRSITRALNKGVEFAKNIASGDLTATVDVNQKDEVGELAEALRNMASRLQEIVLNIRTGSNNIAAASQQISSSSQQLSQGASEQASSTEEITSSMEEMTANVQKNTDNAKETEKISQQTNESMNKMGEAGKKSLESIKNISEKITIINDIAYQTNILALNASVEAARAGEHGRGFAVVASEIRKLAERSREAADEITQLSESSVQLTEESSQLIDDLMPEIEKTSKLVQEISAASQEQKNGAEQVNNSIQQLNDVTQQNASSSEELATNSEELSSQAEQLKKLIAFFKVNS